MTQKKPAIWTPGDWNAFFGFGTNILVNLLVLTGLLRFVLKMPDPIVFGRILPAAGLMLFLSTLYYAYLAWSLAKKTGRKSVCMSDKNNVMRFGGDLWLRTFEEVAKEYPDIEHFHMFVDALTMQMVRAPEMFDVIVTNNMFGDIITDLGAMIQGGMGIAAGGNINPKGVSMFEPIGGSAPKYTGRNVINPLAAICAVGMLLFEIGETQAAKLIENSVKMVVRTRIKDLAAGRMGYSTQQVGDLVVRNL